MKAIAEKRRDGIYHHTINYNTAYERIFQIPVLNMRVSL